MPPNHGAMKPDQLALVVVGAGPLGLSMASAARSAGVKKVLVLGEAARPSWNAALLTGEATAAARKTYTAPEFLKRLSVGLDVASESPVSRIDVDADGVLQVHHDQGVVRTARVAITVPTLRTADAGVHTGSNLRGSVHPHPDVPPIVGGDDVLVSGALNSAAQVALDVGHTARSVILAISGGPGSVLEGYLEELEAHLAITILWNTRIVNIAEVDGYPMVRFTGDVPDLIFDHVIYAPEVIPTDVQGILGIELASQAGDLPAGVFVVTAEDRPETWPDVWTVSPTASASVGSLTSASVATGDPRDLSTEDVQQLRELNYNATIESIREIHSHLWILQVTSDKPVPEFKAGQYATLGLGYWEQRIDRLPDHITLAQQPKIVKRSYSISSPVLDPSGELTERGPDTPLEFYVALVAGVGLQRLPMLTPRLFAKSGGDRIFLGRRIVGGYVLDHVAVDDNVLLLGTGTGEAPHNAMANELLRSGHRGEIVSVVSVRYEIDLGYQDMHRELERRFPNYHYIPTPTREPHSLGNKVYIQDLLRDPRYERDLGIAIDPDRTHVYLCGNPAMIGLPTWDGDVPIFPTREGACEVLHDRGFTLDRRGRPGNVHFEEYW